MVKKKVSKKIKAKKTLRPKKDAHNRTAAFLVGIITVIAAAIALFLYAQNNNYKHILGTQTQFQTLPASE